MASGIYLPALSRLATGNIDFDTDTFKVMLVTSTYTPDFDLHDFRNDITNEVSGTGYTATGNTATVTVNAVDTANNRLDVTLGGTTWTTSTITARGAVYYKSRGGASSADEVIAYNDFGSDVTSTGGTFTLAASTLRFAL
jgi:hypothetical protein